MSLTSNAKHKTQKLKFNKTNKYTQSVKHIKHYKQYVPTLLYPLGNFLVGITSINTLISIGGTLKPYRTKYLHISLSFRTQEEKYSSLANQNVEEINIERK